jgi:hypothetical protein
MPFRTPMPNRVTKPTSEAMLTTREVSRTASTPPISASSSLATIRIATMKN